MRALENRLPPPLVLLGFATVMWWLGGAPFRGPPVATVAGVALILAGVGLVVSGARAFRRAGTTIDPVNIDRAASLVSSGIFARTRNPMYLGFAIMLLGWAAVLAQPWALLGPALFALFIQRFQIAPEERMMAAKFGADFEAYRTSVRRWI